MKCLLRGGEEDSEENEQIFHNDWRGRVRGQSQRERETRNDTE